MMAEGPILITDPKSVQEHIAPVFYFENEFTIDNPTYAMEWFEKIGARNVKYLTRLFFFVEPIYQTDNVLLSSFFHRPLSGPSWYKPLPEAGH